MAFPRFFVGIVPAMTRVLVFLSGLFGNFFFCCIVSRPCAKHHSPPEMIAVILVFNSGISAASFLTLG